jgi:5-methylthioadenosine/S-adenosylhomocysteine deaminase
MTTLIRGGWILTMDERDEHGGELPAGDVLITGETIEAVGVGLTAPPDAEVIDATGLLVLPGLVDTHRHTWQTPLRHLGAQWSLADYLSRLLHEIGGRYRPEDVYAGTLLGALAALDAGVTTLVDWAHIQASPAHSDASVAALRDAGIRAVFAHSDRLRPDAGSRPHPADLRRVRTELLADDNALVTLAMGARGPDFGSIEVTTSDFALARELGIPITTHVAGGRPGPHQRGIAAMADAGLLGPDLTLVHANGASADDLRRLADHGVTVSISPQIELTMPGLGASVALRRMFAAGIRPGLSVDSESVASADLFTQMRFALAAHRADAPEDADAEQGTERPLPAAEVLRLATVDGARTAGLADRVGELTPGKAADLILLRTDAVGLAPLRAAADAMVLAAHPGMVDTVLVAGRVVKRDGRLLADADRARSLAAATADHVLGAAGGTPSMAAR